MAGKMAILGLRHQYARTSGNLETIEHENIKIDALMETYRARRAQNISEIATLTAQLGALEEASVLAFQVDLSGTDSRKTWSKSHSDNWGSITRQVIKQHYSETVSKSLTNESAVEVEVPRSFLLVGNGNATH